MVEEPKGFEERREVEERRPFGNNREEPCHKRTISLGEDGERLKLLHGNTSVEAAAI